MSRSHGLGAWIIAAVAVAALADPRFTRTRVTAAAARTSPATASTTAASARNQSSEDDEIDTLQTIGESLAVDVSTDGLKRRAAWSLGQLRRAVRPGLPPQQNAVRFLKALLDSARRSSKEVAEAQAAMDLLQARIEDNAAAEAALDRIERFIASDFDQIDKPALQLAVLASVVEQRDIHVAFLIATLPDPIDSYTGWQFDPMLDAIAQGVAESDYVLDRFHFPDSDKEDTPGAAAQRGRVHELEPGIVVFKKHVDKYTFNQAAAQAASGDEEEPTPFGNRLVLLVVHENPAAGIHATALARAMRLVIRCRRLTGEREFRERGIRVLGPTFSGSSETLNLALRLVNTRNRVDCAASGEAPGAAQPASETGGGTKCRVRIVSGSATDRHNKSTIENGLSRQSVAHAGQGGPPRPVLEVTFQATVNPDDVLLPALVTKIKDAGWSRNGAVLFEANTQYGRQLWEVFSKEVESTAGREAAPFNFIQLPFPMNVSRLRTTVEAQDPARPVPFGLPSKFRPIPMEAEGNPLDQIPQFNQKTTATYVELALARMLDTMHRERIETVGLMATDPRDKLFLAQQIARYSPDVSIFTAESDSVYIHPDYSPYLRGALVISTYPLYAGNQRWSYAYQGASKRRQFANGSAQGIYNATLALLNYDETGAALVDNAPSLLEYGMPGKTCDLCTPPVWISVVGRSGAWPLRAVQVKNTPDPVSKTDSSCQQAAAAGLNNPCNYVFAVKAPGVPPSRGAQPNRDASERAAGQESLAVFPSPSFRALLTLMTGAILLTWVAQGYARRWSSLTRIDDVDPGPRAYLLACLIGVLLIQTLLWTLCMLRVRVEGTSGLTMAPLLAASLGLVAACHMTARVLASVIREDRHAIRRALRWKSRATLGAFAAVVVCLWSVVNVAQYFMGQAVRDPGDVASFLARALDLGNGVSPTVPVLLLGGALTYWGLIELWRVRHGPVALADPEVHRLINKAVYTDVEKMSSRWDLLNRSMLNVPRYGIAIPALGFVATCTFAFDPIRSWLVTVEGPQFGRFVSAALLLVQVMLTLALVQFVFLWSRIRRLLDFMARHEFAAAYERVPRELFPVTIFPQGPRLADLQIPVAHCAGRTGASSVAEAHAVAVPSESSELETTFRMEMGSAPDTPWAASRTWRALLHGALETEAGLRSDRMLGSAARMRLAQMPPSSPGADLVAKAVAEIVAADRALQQREEDLPAMLIALVVRDALARLAANLIFVIGGVVLAFCSHTLFPFQQHTKLEILSWIYIGVTFTTILTVLVQVKRHEIVARLTSSSPGLRVTWDGGFVLKVAVFALVPLLVLFAAQFPDIGGLLLRWIEPVQRALP